MHAAPDQFMTRRRFLALLGTAALGTVGLGAYGVGIEPQWLEVREMAMPIANLPQPLIGARLVHITDLHAGPNVPSSYLIGALERAAALAPDLTVITGDMMAEEQVQTALAVLAHLRPGRLGAWAVLGNHDYGRGWANARLADELMAGMSELGIRTLSNAAADIEGLQIVGIDDYWAPRCDPSAIVPYVDWQRPALTLAHNPDTADLRSMAAVRGWILAGHTHGGQVRLPPLPPPITPCANPRYTLGEIELGPGRRMYINRGLGYRIRLRLGVRPEIALFHLQRV